jgi:Uma2 family endonuclease
MEIRGQERKIMLLLDRAKSEENSVRLKMDYEEFLEWSDEDVHAEWREGEVVVQMPPKLIHQSVIAFLSQLLGTYVRLSDSGKVMLAPFEVRLSPTGSSREPDLFFVAKENLSRLTQDRLNGPPDLVIEIVSKSSVKYDRDEKFKDYQQSGVREYWIIDPRPGKQRADFYRLDNQGLYRLYATEDDETAASEVIAGFWLRTDWLWQADTLNPLTCLFQIEGVMESVRNQMDKVSINRSADCRDEASGQS